MGEQPVGELAVKAGGESVQQSIGRSKRHVIIGTDAMRIHDIVIREDVSWRASHHGRLQASFVTLSHDIEGGIGRADNSNRLYGE
jgi:hypothetical protein